MTKPQQAELEQVAREFLVRMEKDFTLLLHVEEEGWRVVNRADLHNHVVTLLADTRRATLERVINEISRRVNGMNDDMDGDNECTPSILSAWLKQQIKEIPS